MKKNIPRIRKETVAEGRGLDFVRRISCLEILGQDHPHNDHAEEPVRVLELRWVLQKAIDMPLCFRAHSVRHFVQGREARLNLQTFGTGQPFRA